MNAIKLIAEISLVLFQSSKDRNNVRRRWGIGKGDLKGSGFFESRVRGMLTPSVFYFVEPKGFKGVARDDRHKLSNAVPRFMGTLKCWKIRASRLP